METYATKTHAITISLNDRTIYMKLTDNVNYMTYEANLDNKELRLTIELADAYKMMCNCFAEIVGHKASVSVTAGIMRVTFTALVGGYLNMNFEVILKEKILSNDGQLTTTINRLEQKILSNDGKLTTTITTINRLEQKIQEMDSVINALSNAYVCMSIGGPADASNFINISTKSSALNFTLVDISRIKYLYKLETLTIHYYRTANFTTLSNANVREVTMNCQNEPHLTSLDGLENLPKLESLTINSAPALTPASFISNKYKVKKLVFNQCPQMSASVELRSYCDKHGIGLVCV